VPASGGRALKKAIHVARARAGITSDMQLSLRSGVHYDTFMNWYGDRTRPRGAELQRVATTLGVPFATLEAAYEGREPEPQPLQDAVRDLTGAVRELVVEIRGDRTAQALQLEKVEAVLDGLVQRAMQDGDGRPARETGAAK
jgi:transcriptional regulator with XRE-family HTH domain